jgi:hypothetical protein
MKAWGRAIFAVAAALAVFALPTTVEAKHGYFKSSAGYRVELHLNGTNGYSIQIAGGKSGYIYVDAEKAPARASYFVTDQSTGSGIHARLPGVGGVSVRFRPKGKPDEVPLPDNCRGRGNLIQHGVFVGRIHLHGEQGYTDVDAQRAKGKVVHSFKKVCDNDSSGIHFAGDTKLTLLSASTRRGRGDLSLTAFQVVSRRVPELSGTSIMASFTTRRGSMLTTKLAFASASLDALQLAEPAGSLQSASLSPPGPFTGTASFQRTSKTSSTWEGSLSVELPGLGQVSLAGPKFSSTLCIERRCAGTEDGSSSIVTLGRAPRPGTWPAR